MNEPVALPVLPDPPKTRADCQAGGPNSSRPCQWTSCKHYLDAADGKASCVLDVADQGGATLDEVGGYLGVTRERVRQIETIALRKLSKRIRRED